MYLKEKNLYISEEYDILFDLNQYRIFYITDKIRKYFQNEMAIEELNENEQSILKEILANDIEDTEAEHSIHAVKIHVSNTCNLRCKYCYAHGGNYGKKDSLMDKQTAEKVVHFIHTSEKLKDIQYITFFGGEPLMNPEIIEYICEQTCNDPVSYLLQTNGTILNDKILQILTKYNILVTVSLDGPETVNDLNRVHINGKGTYKEIIQNILAMRQGGVNIVSIEGTMSREILENYSKTEIADLLYKETGIKSIKVEVDENLGYLMSEEEMKKEITCFFENALKDKYLLDCDSYKILSTILSKNYPYSVCPAGRHVLTVGADGNIFPCQLFLDNSDWKMGDIENDFSQNKINELKKSNRQDCADCPAQRTCTACVMPSINKESCDRKRLYQKLFLEIFAKYIHEDQFEKIYDFIENIA